MTNAEERNIENELYQRCYEAETFQEFMFSAEPLRKHFSYFNNDGWHKFCDDIWYDTWIKYAQEKD